MPPAALQILTPTQGAQLSGAVDITGIATGADLVLTYAAIDLP